MVCHSASHSCYADNVCSADGALMQLPSQVKQWQIIAPFQSSNPQAGVNLAYATKMSKIVTKIGTHHPNVLLQHVICKKNSEEGA